MLGRPVHVGRTCRYFGNNRASLSPLKASLEKHREAGLIRKKPIPKSPTPPEIVERFFSSARPTTRGQCALSDISPVVSRHHDLSCWSIPYPPSAMV